MNDPGEDKDYGEVARWKEYYEIGERDNQNNNVGEQLNEGNHLDPDKILYDIVIKVTTRGYMLAVLVS